MGSDRPSSNRSEQGQGSSERVSEAVGVVRVEAVAASLVVTREFPDNADFVTSADRLHAGPGGLDVRTQSGALRLTLS